MYLGILFTFPEIKEKIRASPGKKLTISEYLKHPILALPSLDMFFCICGSGFIDSMISPQLIKIGATQTQIGTSFFIYGAVYLTSTPLAGYVGITIKRFDTLHNNIKVYIG